MRGVRYYGWCRHMHIVRTEESFAMARKDGKQRTHSHAMNTYQ